MIKFAEAVIFAGSGSYLVVDKEERDGEYAKKYMCINIRVPEHDAINIEQKLKSKGIEAANVNAGIVQIRVPD